MKWFQPTMNNGKHIFVFGSNEGGFHGAGAALEALKHWGAIQKNGYGHHGQSFGIPTKDKYIKSLSLSEIEDYIKKFLDFANYTLVHNPEIIFLVTPIGCGYAGYTEKDIKPFFKDAPKNCIFSWDK